MIASALAEDAKSRQLARLQSATRDIGFQEPYWTALDEAVKSVEWLKVETVQHEQAVAGRVRSSEVEGRSRLVAETYLSLSDDATVLQVDTTLSFYAQSHPETPVAKTQVSYVSAEACHDPDRAIDEWTANGAAAYRRALEAAIVGHVESIRIALRFMGGDEGRARPTSLLYRPTPSDLCSSEAGALMAEDKDRVIFRTDSGNFLSLPRSALIPENCPWCC
jgi:hypothetical protein